MKLLIANPGYGIPGGASMPAQLALYRRHPDWDFIHQETTSSLLAWVFNTAWCAALNLREQDGITHFLMLHADVRPRGEDWFDVLLAEMERTQADVLSAIIPIKDQRGLTSTAYDSDPWRPIRITMTQALAMPETWSAEGLLVNTGCLLVDFRKPWVERICFTINDKIERGADGVWRPHVEPEDWHFSRQAHALGARVFVTRKVKVEHFGTGCWANERAWGEPIDPDNGPLFAEKLRAEQEIQGA